MASLDDIWDAPVALNSPKTPRHLDTEDDDAGAQRPSKRPKQALFLSDSEDEGDGRLGRGTVNAPPVSGMDDNDVEALFADVQNDEQLSFKRVEALDLDAMEREAEARHRRTMQLTPHPVMPSSSPARDNDAKGNRGKRNVNDESKEKGPKERRRPVLLNENLLLGPTGFPDLISELKYFKVKGKGREVEDLTRLMRIYHFWTHKLYPKTKFRDTVVRIEKLCHSKRMQVALSVWRDEAHGKTREKDADAESDSDSDNGVNPNTATKRNAQASADYTSERPSTPRSTFSGISTDQDDYINRPPSSRASSQPAENNSDFLDDVDQLGTSAFSRPYPGIASTSTASGAGATKMKRIVVDDDEDEVYWRELEETTTQQPPSQKRQQQLQTHASSVDNLDDEEMWAALEDATNSASKSVTAAHAQTASASARADEMDVDDDDMWNIIQENEKSNSAALVDMSSVPAPKRAPVSDQSVAESEMGWDDMYAD